MGGFYPGGPAGGEQLPVAGIPLYGGEPDNFNNFVLQIGNMIDCSAPRISRKKRELIVYPEQLRNGNEYAEVNHNTYCLDFPNRSMTQGWLVFPQKNESLEAGGADYRRGLHAVAGEV